ncbi:hypothetical protein BASA60_004362 [Batrachochytrium salamandrivorans]|nr:hypothetical protein BASA60_004362 [Batrachochytrium salamandrivorans]
MQLFYLLPFVGVVSHAAALPQPAELSEKHSNNVDITLASLFETRSYQPVLNTREDPVALMSLERRDNSGGNSGGSGTPSPPESTSDQAKNTIGTVFGKDDFNCGKLSSTIDRVGNGIAMLPDDITKVVNMIGGKAGQILDTYFRRALYAKVVLEGWIRNPEESVVFIIWSGLGALEYSKIKPSLEQTAARLTAKIQAGLIEAIKSVSNILKKIGRVGKNMETTHISLRDIFQSYRTFFEELIPILMKFPSGKAYHGYFFDICKSLDKFLGDQEDIYGKFAKAF